MKYFKKGYQGQGGNLYILPVNFDESGRFGYTGDWKHCFAAGWSCFMDRPVMMFLDKYYDESIQITRENTRILFDEYWWNFYTIASIQALVSDMEKFLKSDAEIEKDCRDFMGELCICLRKVLEHCEGYECILFKGP